MKIRVILGWFYLSICLTVIVEWIKFKSLKKAVQFIRESPLIFLINFLIVSSTLALGFLVKRRIFIFMIVSIFWILLSTMNTIVMTLRGYPLMFSDIFLIREGLSLSAHYFTPMILGGIILILGILFWMSYNSFQITLSIHPIQILLGMTYVGIAAYIFNQVEKNREQLELENSDTTEAMGFAYSIADSIYPYLNRKPDIYEEEVMDQIKQGLNSYFNQTSASFNSTVIMIQAESLFDPLRLHNIIISEDPMPTIRTLIKDFPSGVLEVPTFGGGTGKTEFEVLTSMNSDYLGPGEIPHNSFLRSITVDSLATTFKQHGYETIAIHNYEGNFYNRHIAYQNLGFDRFVPIEYMSGIKVNHDLSNMDDAYLFDNILKAYQTFPKSFIYAITAGTHQPYNETEYDLSHPIQIDGDLSLEEKCSLQNYCIRLKRLDDQIARLLVAINEGDEKIRLVLFSDHLPNLPVIQNPYFYPYSHFEVPYLIYSRQKTNVQAPEKLEAFQLGNYLLQHLKLTGGLMEAMHQIYAENEQYPSLVKLAQYDLLYGKQYLKKEQDPIHHSALCFGIDPISILKVERMGDELIIKGAGFNGDSQVYLDHRKVPTFFISEAELNVTTRLIRFSTLVVKQVSGHHQALDRGIKYEANEKQLETH